MASLKKIDEYVVSGTVNSVTVGNANWDSSYDVYKLVITSASTSADAVMQLRVNVSSSPDTTANYDYYMRSMHAGATYENNSSTGGTSVSVNAQRMKSGTAYGLNAVLYIYNANDANEFTYISNEVAQWRDANYLTGGQGAIIHRVQQAINGITLYMDLGADNFTGGTITLYGIES